MPFFHEIFSWDEPPMGDIAWQREVASLAAFVSVVKPTFFLLGAVCKKKICIVSTLVVLCCFSSKSLFLPWRWKYWQKQLPFLCPSRFHEFEDSFFKFSLSMSPSISLKRALGIGGLLLWKTSYALHTTVMPSSCGVFWMLVLHCRGRQW